MGVSWARALHPLGPVGAQGLAYGAALTTQLALIALLGQTRFATLGLGLIAANSVCFLGDAGYASFLLRSSAANPDWRADWHHAAGSRLIILAAMFPVVWIALGWSSPTPAEARMLFLAAGPGILLSALNTTPILFGLGHVRHGSAGILARALLQALGGIGIAMIFPGLTALGLGIVFSLGMAAQIVVGLHAGLPPALLRPSFAKLMPPPPVWRLWGVSLAGTLSDRALPFLIGAARPGILAIALIAIQIMQALSGLGGQMNRLLIPAAAQGDAPDQLWRGLRRPLAVLTFIVTACVWGAAALWRPDQQGLALLLSLEWAAVLAGGLSFSLVFAREAEKPVIRLMLWLVPLSTAGQVLMVGHASLESILGLRVLTAAAVAWQTVRTLTPRGEERHA